MMNTKIDFYNYKVQTTSGNDLVGAVRDATVVEVLKDGNLIRKKYPIQKF